MNLTNPNAVCLKLTFLYYVCYIFESFLEIVFAEPSEEALSESRRTSKMVLFCIILDFESVLNTLLLNMEEEH